MNEPFRTVWYVPGDRLFLIVKGKRGAAVLTKELSEIVTKGKDYPTFSIDYHSRKPRREGQPEQGNSCEFIDDAQCYCDGRGIHRELAVKFEECLNIGDMEKLWSYLEEEYNDLPE